MGPDLDTAARERVAFAAKVLVGFSKLAGEGNGCRTFYTAEDNWRSAFHACACTPQTLSIQRYILPEAAESYDE